MACFAWADSASCLHCNSAWGVQSRNREVIEGLASCAPTSINLYKSAVVFATGKPASTLKLGRRNSSGQWKMCTWRKLHLHVIFNMISPSLKAVVLACCHIWAPHWGADTAPASVSQCISLFTSLYNHMHLAPTQHWQISISIWPLSGGLIQEWQMLHDPWGRRKDHLRTEGNDSIGLHIWR